MFVKFYEALQLDEKVEDDGFKSARGLLCMVRAMRYVRA
jgi:hypothetical protein